MFKKNLPGICLKNTMCFTDVLMIVGQGVVLQYRIFHRCFDDNWPGGCFKVPIFHRCFYDNCPGGCLKIPSVSQVL
jgi:hypothetical protein